MTHRSVRIFWYALLVCPFFAGCQWLNNLGPTPDVTPVMGEPPPRMPVARHRSGENRHSSGTSSTTPDSAEGGTHSAGTGTSSPSVSPGDFPGNLQTVSQTSGEEPDDNPDLQFTGAQVVATVNGSPILASEILERYGNKLEEVRRQATPAQMKTIRERLLKRDLEMHVERRLLVQSLRASIPKKNLEKLDQAINEAFDKEIERLKKEMKVRTKAEVQEKLAREGTSLANLRDAFANQQMATFYFQQKAKTKIIIGRRELLDYYNAHLADYAIPARARWQEIQISFEEHGGREAAFALLQKAVGELKAGTDFAAVAKKYSDGSTAAKGGYWDWTVSGSLTDKRLERALFELPLRQISQVMEDERSFRLIRVVERTPARWKPFEDVQQEIKHTLTRQARKKAAERVMDDLMRSATITTLFDDDPDFRPRWRRLASPEAARTSRKTSAGRPVSPPQTSRPR